MSGYFYYRSCVKVSKYHILSLALQRLKEINNKIFGLLIPIMISKEVIRVISISMIGADAIPTGCL